MTAHVDTFVRDRLPPPEAQPEFLFDLPELQYPERLNAAVELIDRGDPEALAVVNDNGRWTYGEMRGLSDRIARVLTEEEDLIPGDRVLLRGPNGAILFACWLGVLKAGGCVVPTQAERSPGRDAAPPPGRGFAGARWRRSSSGRGSITPSSTIASSTIS